MALTGELTDLSLAELIEFFCNQRKTGRLKVVYPNGPGYFYLQSGSVVHARIGVLRGIEAVFYALTLPNASFAFSPAFEAPEHSINQPWTSVVLEGLRRMDEGVRPKNPFPDDVQVQDDEPEAEVEEIGIVGPSSLKIGESRSNVDAASSASSEIHLSEDHSKGLKDMPVEPALPNAEKSPLSVTPREVDFAPFLSQSESASKFGSGPWRLTAVLAAVAII